MSARMLTFERDRLLALIRESDQTRGTILFLSRAYGLAAVRAAAKILTKRTPAPSASRADMAYAMSASLRPQPVKERRTQKRNTSPAACREALFGPLLSTTD